MGTTEDLSGYTKSPITGSQQDDVDEDKLKEQTPSEMSGPSNKITINKLDGDDIGNIDIFCLCLINLDNPNAFMPVEYGYVFRRKPIDDNTIEIHFFIFRLIRISKNGPQIIGQNNEAIILEFPPRVRKWLLDIDAYEGSKPFSKDDVLGPGHHFRMMWIPPPPEEVGNAVEASAEQRILTPGKRIVAPSGHIPNIK